MTTIVLQFTILSIVSALALAFVPTRMVRIAIIVVGFIALSYAAPFSLLWMLVLTGSTWGMMQIFRDAPSRFPLVAVILGVSMISLLVFREMEWLTALGAAYFTMRIMHVALEWWMGRIEAPDLVALLSYMLFLPVFIVGPIHRFPNFDRELDRRRVTLETVFQGLERVLLGLFMVIVLGGLAVSKVKSAAEENLPFANAFALDWAISAMAWIELYFVFAGLSAVAVGAARIIGVNIEENFNQPYKARSLVEFWSRWHMTLTHWCRDYVYQPFATSMRNPVVGVFAAMLVLGLWHESSAYYILWSMWQATGIVASQLLRPWSTRLPDQFDRMLSPVLILGWLSLAQPVVNRLLEIST